MFIISFKTTAKKVFITLGVVLLVCCVALAISVLGSGQPEAAQCAGKNYSLLADDNKSRTDFLRQFGWETGDDPVSYKTVTIPFTFNDVYENYNKIQLSQGLDLTPYKGKQCESYTYQISNYPYDGEVYANMLIYNGCVIGGDICSFELDGFMYGFCGKQE
ncbi:MAG: DUF4830 domain-containing protein [Clostridiales bacterium]|nr:DUF4830 domain-containing protein [Clostridiales bacterium]